MYWLNVDPRQSSGVTDIYVSENKIGNQQGSEKDLKIVFKKGRSSTSFKVWG